MSSEDYSKRSEKVRKALNTLRKDINYRDEQEKRGEATYALDAEINGQFSQINEELQALETMANNFKTNFKDYNLTFAEGGRRYKTYEQLNNDRNTLKRNYEALFAKKELKREVVAANSMNKFDQKYQHANMSTKELNSIRQKQEEEQEEVLDELIVGVKNLKKGGNEINNELTEQEQLLGTLDGKMDNNIESMGSARRRMTRLLESSSNCCLISVLVLEIAAVVVIWILL